MQIDIGILIIGYARSKLFESAVRSVNCLGLPKKTPIYVVIDGPKKSFGKKFEENKKVKIVANKLLDEGLINELILRKKNLGTKNNVYQSVSHVLKKHEYIFVLEDDLEILPIAKGTVEALIKLMNNKVSAFGIYCHKSFSKSFFYSKRFESQAWGTNRQSWNEFNPTNTKNINLTINDHSIIKKELGTDLLNDFAKFKKELLDSWAVPWNIHNYVNNKLMVYTPFSYIKNNSHCEGAERTKGIEFEYVIAKQPINKINSKFIKINKNYIKHYTYLARIKRRFKSKIPNFFK